MIQNTNRRITLNIPPLSLADCMKLRGGNNYEDPLEVIGPELEAAYCIADGYKPEPGWDTDDRDWMQDLDNWMNENPFFGNEQGQDNKPDDQEKEKGYDPYKAAAYARDNALPGKKGEGRCAEFVLNALNAGGFDIGERGSRNYSVPTGASIDNNFLRPLGFERVDGYGYEPRIGDVLVIEALDNYIDEDGKEKGHPSGHTAIYDGYNWISDFIQDSMFGLSDADHYDLWGEGRGSWSIWRY